MASEGSLWLRAPGVAAFDVICAGEARWDLSAPGAIRGAGAGAVQFLPAGSAVVAAVALARRGLRVGLCAALGDDTPGRALRSRVAAAGVDIGGVSLTPPQRGLFLVEGMGAAARVVSHGIEEAPVVVPEHWASQVLLLSGLSPIVAHAGAFCKEARSARRAGSVVVLDVHARRHLWAGRDPRVIRSVIQEADVVRYSAEDMAVLGVPAPMVRGMMRPRAALVVTSPKTVSVTGSFGEVGAERGMFADDRLPAEENIVANLCAELAKAGPAGVEREELWMRVALHRGATPLGRPAIRA